MKKRLIQDYGYIKQSRDKTVNLSQQIKNNKNEKSFFYNRKYQTLLKIWVLDIQ